MAHIVMTIEQVKFDGKWVEFISRDRAVNLTGLSEYDASSKVCALQEAVRKSDMIEDIRNNGYKGKKLRWVNRGDNYWEIDSFVTNRTLSKVECLALDIDLYNTAMEAQWAKDKIKKNLSGDLSVCKHCERKYVISCICDKGQEEWNSMLQEVIAISNRDRSNENY